jgi:hypothetical protein
MNNLTGRSCYARTVIADVMAHSASRGRQVNSTVRRSIASHAHHLSSCWPCFVLHEDPVQAALSVPLSFSGRPLRVFSILDFLACHHAATCTLD